MVELRPWRERVERLEKDYRSQKAHAKAISDPQAKSNARIKAIRTRLELDYWRDKVRRFEITADKLTDPETGISGFKRRQLVDTGIMCSHAVEFLRSVYPAVYAVNGAATSFARKAWGIQSDEVKDRTEHTHHAKDAMVIAALTPARFNAICAALKDDGSCDFRRACDVCKPPYANFAERVRKAAAEILVKHVVRQTTLRQSSKRNALAKAHPSKSEPGKIVRKVLSRGDTVRGALHKDTFYGCIADPVDGKTAFVVRKPLVGPLKDAVKLIDKIVDSAVRKIVKDEIERLSESGVKNIEAGMLKMPSGVPINKVRIYAQTTKPAKLKDHDMTSDKDYKNPYYVTSAEGSNFRLGVFDYGGKISVKPDNSLEWAKKHKLPDYKPLHEQTGFAGYIVPGAMAIATRTGTTTEVSEEPQAALSRRLYKIVKFESSGRVTFRYHSEARASVILEADLVARGKHKKGESSIDYDHPHELLLMSSSAYLKTMLIEGIHFRFALDGTITFIK